MRQKFKEIKFLAYNKLKLKLLMFPFGNKPIFCYDEIFG